MTSVRLVRPVDAIAVHGTGAEPLHVAMPDFVAEFGKRDPLHLGLSGGVEEAELDLRGMGGEEAEVHPASVPRGTLRVGRACTDLPGYDWLEFHFSPRKEVGSLFLGVVGKRLPTPFRSDQRIQAAQGAQDFGDAPGLRDTPARSIRRFRVEYLADRADAGFAQVGRKRFEQRARRTAVGRMHAEPGIDERTNQPRPDRPLVVGGVPGSQVAVILRPVIRDAQDRASGVRTGSTVGRAPLRAPAASGSRRESDEAARWPIADSDGRRDRLPFRRPPRRKGAVPLRTRSGG